MESQSEVHAKDIKITFKIAIFTKSLSRTNHKNLNVEWVSIDKILDNLEPLIDSYLNLDNPSCCEFQGGFFIEIDGNPWNDEGYVDEFRMTHNWFWALNKLLENDIARFSPWEESEMYLERNADGVLIKDYGLIPCWVPLKSLYNGIIDEGYKFADLIDKIKVHVDRRKQVAIDKNDYRILDLIVTYYDEYDFRGDIDKLSNAYIKFTLDK